MGRGRGVAKGGYAIRPKSVCLDLINRRLRKGGGEGGLHGGCATQPKKSFILFAGRGEEGK